MSGREDPIIFLRVMEDPIGVEGVKKLVLTSPTPLIKLCTMRDVHLVWTGGSNDFSTSYGGSTMGGGCKKKLVLTSPRLLIVET
jgi:hypothetical protein